MKKNITPTLLQDVIIEEGDFEKILKRLDISHGTFYNYLNKEEFAEVKNLWKKYSRKSNYIVPQDMLIEKIEEFFGNLYDVSEYFCVTRASIYYRINNEEEVKIAFNNARENWSDFLIHKLHNKLDDHRTFLFAAINQDMAMKAHKLKERILEAGLPEDTEQLTLTSVPKYKD